jgi:hypothetical protein
MELIDLPQDLDAINEHFNFEHQQHLSTKTNDFTKSSKLEEKNETSMTQDRCFLRLRIKLLQAQ